MDRRTYLGLVAGGMAAMAGCSSVLESEEYEVGNKESLLPDEVGDDWPDTDLEPNHDYNENFARVWLTPDESLLVLMGATIYDSIDAAEESMDKIRATASSPKDYPVADDAVIYDDGEAATCIFRDSNAIGEVVVTRKSGLQWQPDRTRASQYAEVMYEEWPTN